MRAGDTLKGLKLPHGQSKVQRKIEIHFGQEPPATGGPHVPVWVRDGWNDDEKSVLADARADGAESPLVTVFLPQRQPEDLKKSLAGAKASRETLHAKGRPTTAEGIDAYTAMETRRRMAEQTARSFAGRDPRRRACAARRRRRDDRRKPPRKDS